MTEESSSLVSILIPTYNRAWGLRGAIASALAQTHTPIEIVVVDDASPDDTADVLRAFPDSRVRSERQPRNVGMVGNWGRCVELARGEFAVFLADDDALAPDFVRSRVALLRGDSEAVAVFGGYERRTLDGSSLGTHPAHRPDGGRLAGRALLDAVLGRDLYIASALYRSAALRELWPAIAKDDLVLDFGLNVRMALRSLGPVLYAPRYDVTVTSHPGQNTEARREEATLQGIACLERLVAEAPEWARAPLRKELANTCVVWGRHLRREGRRAEAMACFARAIREAPWVWVTWYQWARALGERLWVWRT